MENTIEQNIRPVEKCINQASQRAVRDPDEVQVILAVKTVEPQRILEAAELGYKVVGDNRIKEAPRKIEQMGDRAAEPEWHYIGHMQSNKVNKIVPVASMVRSIDRVKIVRKMNCRLEKVDKTMDVLIQVNTSGEESKYGVHPAEAVEFVEKAVEYERLNIKGLMTIGLFSDDWSKVRKGFAQLRHLRDTIAARNIPGVRMEHLSMGMIGDHVLGLQFHLEMTKDGLSKLKSQPR